MKQAVSSTRVKKSAIELSDEAASRIRALLDARHKVREDACEVLSRTSCERFSRTRAELPQTGSKEERMQRYELHAELRW